MVGPRTCRRPIAQVQGSGLRCDPTAMSDVAAAVDDGAVGLPPSKRRRRDSEDTNGDPHGDPDIQGDATYDDSATGAADTTTSAPQDPTVDLGKQSLPKTDAPPPQDGDPANQGDNDPARDDENRAADHNDPPPADPVAAPVSANGAGQHAADDNIDMPRHPVASPIPVADGSMPVANEADALALHQQADIVPPPQDHIPNAAAAQGPQQQYGNSVLAPEVSAVLNGLFERGFFEDRDIDARAIDFLASVPPELALAALEDIQHRDFSAVRNKPAFIFSIFKRVVASGGAATPTQPPPGGFAPATVPPSALSHLPPQVSDSLQRVFSSGVCHPSQFDDRAMDILVELHPMDAVRALSEFAAMEPGRVRNPSAFWMGLARKYKNQSQNGGARGAPYGAAAPGGAIVGGAGGAYTPQVPMGAGGPGAGMYGSDMTGGAAMGGGYALQQRLEELHNVGVLPRDALDDRAADALRKLPEQDALSVLDELPEPHRVRNMSAYVMGLCKKFATGEARSLMQGRHGGAGAGMAAGGYPGAPGVGAPGMAPPMGGPEMAVPPPGAPNAHGYVPDARELHDALSRMDADVRGRFYAMVDRGMFPETAFDNRAIGALEALNAGEACAALDELAASDPRRIHNISAYFMGLARKFGRGQ